MLRKGFIGVAIAAGWVGILQVIAGIIVGLAWLLGVPVESDVSELFVHGIGSLGVGFAIDPRSGYVKPWMTSVDIERDAQDKEWGGHGHDDRHHPGEWIEFIHHQTRRIMEHDWYGPVNEAAIRQRWVKIAALAVAALESSDRRVARREETDPLGRTVQTPKDATS